MKEIPPFQRRQLLRLGILGFGLLVGCTDEKDKQLVASEKQAQPKYHLMTEAEMPPRHSRERVAQDLALDILTLKDDVKDSINGSRERGNSFTVGHKRYTSLAAWRADLNRVRDSLLATGTADLSDTLKVATGHISNSIPTPEEYRHN